MHETGCTPVAHAWLKQTLHWWNRIVARPGTDIVKIALKESIDTFRDRKPDTWAGHLALVLMRIVHHVHDAPDVLDCMRNLQPLPVRFITTTLHDKWYACAFANACAVDAQEVRQVPDNVSIGFTTFKFLQWFRNDVGPTPYVDTPERVHALAQFRLCAHHLNCEIMHSSCARSLRRCKCCSQQVLEDEMHTLECDAYHDIRANFPDLFTIHSLEPGTITDAIVHDIFCKSDKLGWNRLADFIIQVFAKRRSILSALADRSN
jgi:hypothetical protein